MRIALVLLIAGLVGIAILWLLPQNTREETVTITAELPTESVAEDIRDVTPPDALPGPKISKTKVSRLPAVKPSPPTKSPVKPLSLSKLIIPQAGIFFKNDIRIELAHIVPLKLGKTCTASNNDAWPCGRFARTAMRRFIRSRSIQCGQIPKDQEVITTKCSVAGQDIALWLVKQGWAMPIGDKYSEALEQAKNKKTGMWRASRP